MAYATSDDFIAAFGESEWLQLTDRDLDDSPDAGVAAAAFGAASDLIDGYARGIYQVPLSPVDPIIKQIALDLSRWFLSGNMTTDRVSEGRANAMKTLTDIASQRLLLTSLRISEGGAPGIAYSTPSAGFTIPTVLTAY